MTEWKFIGARRYECSACGEGIPDMPCDWANCDTCRFELYFPEMCEGCCEWDSHYEPKDEPQTERSER